MPAIQARSKPFVAATATKICFSMGQRHIFHWWWRWKEEAHLLNATPCPFPQQKEQGIVRLQNSCFPQSYLVFHFKLHLTQTVATHLWTKKKKKNNKTCSKRGMAPAKPSTTYSKAVFCLRHLFSMQTDRKYQLLLMCNWWKLGMMTWKERKSKLKQGDRHFQQGGVALAVLKKIYTLLVVFESVKWCNQVKYNNILHSRRSHPS